MPLPLLALILGLWAWCLPCHGLENVVGNYTALHSLTTAKFTVHNKWEMRFDSPGGMVITVYSSDGTVVAGMVAISRGSLYLPKGGVYYLQIDGDIHEKTVLWKLSVIDIESSNSEEQRAKASYFPPATAPAPGPTNIFAEGVVPPIPTPETKLETPLGQPGPGEVGLTEAQSHAVVLIKGDEVQGTGFLMKTADGPVVVTNIHVISANPNLKILTTMGEQIKTLSLKGASDRDLAMFAIQDNHYSYLEAATEIDHTVHTSDEVVTPGNSQGGEVLLNTEGVVLAVGPDRIEISNPIFHGNSGGPVFHPKSDKVVGVVTYATRVNTSNALDKASFARTDSAITERMRYFGFRIDTVPKWETYDWNRFQNETVFLRNFAEISRCLDSYLNGEDYEKRQIAGNDEDSPPGSLYYHRNEKIQRAEDNFHKLSTDADNSQRLDAFRELTMDLESTAADGMDVMTNPSNFYSFNQIRAKQELAYRKALKDEIGKMTDKISDMGH